MTYGRHPDIWCLRITFVFVLDGLGFLFQWEAITELVSSDHQLQIIYGRNLSNQNSANSQKRVDLVLISFRMLAEHVKS